MGSRTAFFCDRCGRDVASVYDLTLVEVKSERDAESPADDWRERIYGSFCGPCYADVRVHLDALESEIKEVSQ